MNIAGIEINKEKVFAFFSDPKTQATIRAWIVAPSGYLAVQLGKWFGVDATQLGFVATWAIYLAPYAVVYAWSIAQKTHAAIIKQAAVILADKQAGSIIINANAKPALQAVAATGDHENVVSAATTEAKQAANGG